MTPLQIEILIHYAVSFTDYDPARLDAPAVKEAIDDFIDDGILERNEAADAESKYIGNRAALQPYLDALCTVPKPKWMVG